MPKPVQHRLLPVFFVLFLFQSLQVVFGSPIAQNDESGRGVAEIDGIELISLGDVNGNGNSPENVNAAAEKTNPSPANSTPPNEETMRESITYVTQEAIDAYKKHGDCLPAFFDVTNENLREANVSLWYNNFITSKAKENPEAYKQFGEVSLFAREIMQTSDFECNLQSKGCNHMPSCKEVTNHLERRNSGLTTPQLLDQSRKIYLAFKQMDSISKYISTMHVSNTKDLFDVMWLLTRPIGTA